MYSSEKGFDVVLLFAVKVVIDKGKSGRSSSTELGFESVDRDDFLLAIEFLGNGSFNGIFGDIRLFGVNQFNGLEMLR